MTDTETEARVEGAPDLLYRAGCCLHEEGRTAALPEGITCARFFFCRLDERLAGCGRITRLRGE